MPDATPSTRRWPSTITELPPPPAPRKLRGRPKPKRRRVVRAAPSVPVVSRSRCLPPRPAPVPSHDRNPIAAAPSESPEPAAGAARRAGRCSAAPALPRRISAAHRPRLPRLSRHARIPIGQAVYRLDHSGNDTGSPPLPKRADSRAVLSRARQGHERRHDHADGPAADELQHRAHQQRSAGVGDLRLGIRHGAAERRQVRAARAADLRSAGRALAVLLRAAREDADAVQHRDHAQDLSPTRSVRDGGETVTLPFGDVETQIWRRLNGDGAIEAQVWLAPSLHFVAVKVRLSNARATVERCSTASASTKPSRSNDCSREPARRAVRCARRGIAAQRARRRVLRVFFRHHAELGQHDRAFIADGVFATLRRLRSLCAQAESSRPPPRASPSRCASSARACASWRARCRRAERPGRRRFNARQPVLSPARSRRAPRLAVGAALRRASRRRARCAGARVALARAAGSARQPADDQARSGARRSSPRPASRRSRRRIRRWASASPASPRFSRIRCSLPARSKCRTKAANCSGCLVAPRRNDMVVDFCAGAGGKTLLLGALMRSQGRIYAFDVRRAARPTSSPGSRVRDCPTCTRS